MMEQSVQPTSPKSLLSYLPGPLKRLSNIYCQRIPPTGGWKHVNASGESTEEDFTRERQLEFAATKEKNTADAESAKYLRIALRLVGLTFIFGIYIFCLVWPSRWAWHAGPIPHYLQMILESMQRWEYFC